MPSFKTPDRVKQTATTTGTGDFTLSGSITGSRDFSAVCSTGDTVPYVIQLVDGTGAPGSEWEVGTGTYSAANTLTRTTVLASSNAGALVNFSAGSKQVWVGLNGTMAAWIRERLYADRTYYVRSDGSDSNDGRSNTSGGAFLTLQKAVNTVVDNIDLGGYNVTIQLADATYSGNTTLRKFVGRGAATIQGNSGTPANVVLSASSGNVVLADYAAVWTIKDLKITNSSGSGVNATRKSVVFFGNLDFGACTGGYHVSVGAGAFVSCTSNYAITGAAVNHVYCDDGRVTGSSRTVTITGTPAFTNFVYGRYGAVISLTGYTFSGSATGQRYYGILGAVIDTNGGGANYFPGNSAGAVTTPAVYA